MEHARSSSTLVKLCDFREAVRYHSPCHMFENRHKRMKDVKDVPKYVENKLKTRYMRVLYKVVEGGGWCD